MLMALISSVVFGFLYTGLWLLWRRYAPALVSPATPQWITRPNFFLFVGATLVFVLLYKHLSRR